MTDTPPPPPPAAPIPMGPTCPSCGSTSTRSERRDLTQKQRVKFGVGWLLITIFTGGIGFVAWLVWPRKNIVIGVDRFSTCLACKREF